MMALTDLSHVVATGMTQVKVLPPVRVSRIMSMTEGAPLNVQEICIASHSGTHIDAPLHALPSGASLDQLPLEAFFGPAVVIPVDRRGGEAIEPGDLASADVRRDDIVLVATGWDRFFGDPETYYLHPFLSDAAADWLVERRVKMLAMDVLSPDRPMALRDAGFAYYVHRRLLGSGILIAENLRGAAPLGARRARAYAFPLSYRDGDAGPVRFVLEV